MVGRIGLGPILALLLLSCAPKQGVERATTDPSANPSEAANEDAGAMGAPSADDDAGSVHDDTPGVNGGRDGSGQSEPGGAAGSPMAGMSGTEPPDAGAFDPADDDAGNDPVANESLLKVTFEAAPASTNLTTGGTLDWKHYGLGGDGETINGKQGGDGIVDLTPIGRSSFGHYDDRPITFSWSDGTPRNSAANVADGAVAGLGRSMASTVGFRLRARGTPATKRTLRVHVGVWEGTGHLKVSMEGAPSAFENKSLVATHPGADRVYIIEYQPLTAGAMLTVQWTLDSPTHEFSNATMQAVTLSED